MIVATYFSKSQSPFLAPTLSTWYFRLWDHIYSIGWNLQHPKLHYLMGSNTNKLWYTLPWIVSSIAYSIQVNKVDKFSPKDIPSVFLGYSSLQKGYKLYDLHTKEFFNSRDVSFKKTIYPSKTIYPFSQVSTSGTSIFLVLQFSRLLSESTPISVIDSRPCTSRAPTPPLDIPFFEFY